MALLAKNNASKRPREINSNFGFLKKSSMNFMIFSLYSFDGMISMIRICNWAWMFFLPINGRCGIIVNKKRKAGGRAIMKL